MNLAAEYRRFYESLSKYEAFAAVAEEHLREALVASGIGHESVKARVKEPTSVFRKLMDRLRKEDARYLAHGLGAMTDRVGLRVVVVSRPAVAPVIEAARAAFDVSDVDEKSLNNPPHELRYLGTHLTATLHESEQQAVGHPPIAAMPFEIQVHTLSETAWANVSHPLLYKPYGQPLPATMAHKVYRTVALVSLFDSEVEQVMTYQRSSPDYDAAQMLKVCERLFAPWRVDASDNDLSLEILEVVKSTYDGFTLEQFEADLTSFVEENRDELEHVLARHATDREQPLLSQPEALAIAERLSRAKLTLRRRWLEHGLDGDALHNVASALGSTYVRS